jgi:hypothetical protein
VGKVRNARAGPKIDRVERKLDCLKHSGFREQLFSISADKNALLKHVTQVPGNEPMGSRAKLASYSRTVNGYQARNGEENRSVLTLTQTARTCAHDSARLQ